VAYIYSDRLQIPELADIGIDYGFGPWVLGNGTFSTPIKQKGGPPSALQSGAEAQISFIDQSAAILQRLNLGFAPYYQTDFIGLASINGVNIHLEPKIRPLLLATSTEYYDLENKLPFVFTWNIFGEGQFYRVENPGLTYFSPRTNYAWVGGTAKFSLLFFHGDGWSPYIEKRFYANLFLQHFSDLDASAATYRKDIEFGYKLTPGDQTGRGSFSLSATYSKGKDITTLQDLNQIKVQLSFKN
jgi:hypothetical protein